MKSKYKERAKEIFDVIEWIDPRDGQPWHKGDIIVNAMCQLAEEMVKDTEIEINNVMREEGIWTKNQVEELLQKQRELCAEYIYEHEESFYCLAMKNTVLKFPIVKL